MSQYNVLMIIIVYLVLKATILFDKFSHYKKPLLLLCKFVLLASNVYEYVFREHFIFPKKHTYKYIYDK